VVTGQKHCLDRLAGFLGLRSFSPEAYVANLASFAWMILAPLALLGALALVIRNRRARQPACRRPE
jgi:hypothetical protein